MSDIGWTWGVPQGGGGDHEQVKHWLSNVLIPYGKKFWQAKNCHGLATGKDFMKHFFFLWFENH